MARRSVVIVGPTCSGKTKLSVDLALKLNGEIISADSRQIYQYLNIGTAKPDPEILSKVKHHFIDYLNPRESYNVSRFEKESLQVIENLFDAEKIPVIVGGSGLYIKALIDGIMDEVETDPEYRKELLELRKTKGDEYLYRLLVEVDPKSAEKMIPKNWKRIIRALEVFRISGKRIWEFHDSQTNIKNVEFIQFGLRWDRETLYKNIDERVDNMVVAGLLDEVKSLLEKGFSKELNSLNTVGYKEIISFLEGECDFEKSVELIKRNTRRFAKRQITWFKADSRIKWIDVENNNELDKVSDFIYNEYLNIKNK